MRVQTSDLPILLSVTTRIQTLDLKTSPSALQALVEIWVDHTWGFKPHSYTMLLQQSRKINFLE